MIKGPCKFCGDEYVKTRSEILKIRSDVQDCFNSMPICEFKGHDQWSFIQGILSTIDYILDENDDSICSTMAIDGTKFKEQA